MASKDFRGRIERHPLASFFVLTYTTSWLAWLMEMLGYRGDLDQSLSTIAKFGSALAALVLVATTRGALGYVPTLVR